MSWLALSTFRNSMTFQGHSLLACSLIQHVWGVPEPLARCRAGFFLRAGEVAVRNHSISESPGCSIIQSLHHLEPELDGPVFVLFDLVFELSESFERELPILVESLAE